MVARLTLAFLSPQELLLWLDDHHMSPLNTYSTPYLQPWQQQRPVLGARMTPARHPPWLSWGNEFKNRRGNCEEQSGLGPPLYFSAARHLTHLRDGSARQSAAMCGRNVRTSHLSSVPARGILWVHRCNNGNKINTVPLKKP